MIVFIILWLGCLTAGVLWAHHRDNQQEQMGSVHDHLIADLLHDELDELLKEGGF